jgi:hypothetical protein
MLTVTVKSPAPSGTQLNRTESDEEHPGGRPEYARLNVPLAPVIVVRTVTASPTSVVCGEIPSVALISGWVAAVSAAPVGEAGCWASWEGSERLPKEETAPGVRRIEATARTISPDRSETPREGRRGTAGGFGLGSFERLGFGRGSAFIERSFRRHAISMLDGKRAELFFGAPRAPPPGKRAPTEGERLPNGISPA